ncbi:Hypothetical protein POVR1_LOCUS568 [uncultured virus]|nr:Hypothetical protein POVR1_LOCUS568 [uncultured virus]
MGTVPTRDSNFHYSVSDIVIKEFIVEATTVTIVSTPDTIEIFKYWYETKKNDDFYIWIIAWGKDSSVEMNWFEPGSEPVKDPERHLFKIKLDKIKSPHLMCITFRPFGAAIDILISGSWHRLEKRYTTKFRGNEIILS